MEPNPRPAEYSDDTQDAISYYRLDFLRNGNKHYYIWRQHPCDESAQPKAGLLIDLNNIYVPGLEIEKMVCSFLVPAAGVISIAFVNCHSHNQQEIKRKLKAGDIWLYSKTAFFLDVGRARQWLEAQCANC